MAPPSPTFQDPRRGEEHPTDAAEASGDVRWSGPGHDRGSGPLAEDPHRRRAPVEHAPAVGTALRAAPGSRAASQASANTNALKGTTSLGLSTTVQPAVIAGATFSAIWLSG